MLVTELKKIISSYDQKEHEKIIVELYKRIPKRVKEDYEIDDFITNLKDQEKAKKEERKVTFEQLEKEVRYFLQCVQLNLYAGPNKVISKVERSKWRFKVKTFYKELNSILPDTKDGNMATDLLKQLYKCLSYGTRYLNFSNWNTFGAIQISQDSFLETIMKRKLMNGLTKENMIYCVELLDVEYDPNIWHRDILISFQNCLKTTDAKYLALEVLKEIISSKFIQLKNNNNHNYWQEEYYNYHVECVMDIYFNLCEYENAIRFFHKYYLEKKLEVKEYILLEKLKDMELYNEWIKEYEKHVKKIDYRQSLKDDYNEIKKS